MLDITNYGRWMTATVAKHFNSKRSDIAFYLEGQTRLTQDEVRWFELRLNGPKARPIGSKNEYDFYLEVNVLCQTSFDDKDVYALKKMLGIAAQALNQDLCVFQYGDDDSTYVGVLQLIAADGIDMHDFGQVDPKIKVVQGSVEAHYCMILP